MTTSPDNIRVLVVDDHTLLREAVRDVLLAERDFAVVGEAGDADRAVLLAGQTKPDVVVLDLEMPGHHPVRTVQQLQRLQPAPKVIILTMHDDPLVVQEMLRTGVAGYLHKGVSRHDLVLAIRSVSRGDQRVTIVAPRASTARAEHGASRLLTEREQEVLALVARALSNRQIAARLSITEGTVKRHLRNIFGKLGAVSRIDAVNKAGTAAGSEPGRYPVGSVPSVVGHGTRFARQEAGRPTDGPRRDRPADGPRRDRPAWARCGHNPTEPLPTDPDRQIVEVPIVKLSAR
jgi:DNA-binding NarL/FixJ family response regulator